MHGPIYICMLAKYMGLEWRSRGHRLDRSKTRRSPGKYQQWPKQWFSWRITCVCEQYILKDRKCIHCARRIREPCTAVEASWFRRPDLTRRLGEQARTYAADARHVGLQIYKDIAILSLNRICYLFLKASQWHNLDSISTKQIHAQALF
jgi:hypothetical protein